ncbi:hypothetical protein [Brachyspira pilosicoli]|uniref:hypothetical protein n=1 Tax=Brachyspira pilosicoli TaxID=52584 RepID=UPI000C7649F4|nr:hypothetical protein [Brachyspira pilosicoli]PLV54701.1 hypothetical protein BPSP16_12570 [Brachyspira pilosicoli SP16]
MRAYRIELTSKNGVSIGGNNQPNYQPPTTLVLQQNLGNMDDNIHIEFEYVSHCDTSNKEVYDRAVLSLYNVNRYWHNENSAGKLAGARIVIYAGVKATPIHYRQGLVDPQNTCYALNDNQILITPIYDGYVANTYANMDGVSTVLVMNLIPVKELTEEEKASVNQLNIALGIAWRNEVKRFIDNYLKLVGSNCKVKRGIETEGSVKMAEANLNSIDINGIFDTEIGGTTLESVIRNSFHEVIEKDISSNIIYIGKNPTIENKNNIISDRDLLGQPQLIDVKTILFTVPLTSKYKVRQLVTLNLESFISYNQAYITEGDPNNYGIGIARDISKMYSGVYRITKIQHVLQSRNVDVNAWCTNITAVEENKSSI